MATNERIRNERLPHWMKAKFPGGKRYMEVKNRLEAGGLHTICTSGKCPNRGECWAAGTASFMILGNKCTRNCRFCSVPNMVPDPPDWNEPARLGETIRKLGVKHVVITSVDRDDLDDGGADFWAHTIEKVKEINPGLTMECLIPDFRGKKESVKRVIDAQPDVISHNLETVGRISPQIRSMARYRVSLEVIRQVAGSGLVPKSGIMVGLGETREEVLATMDDLRASGCRVITIGQYLQPASHLMKVKEYISPETFEFYRQEGLKRGFTFVESSPLVRSSYHAERHING